MLTAEFVPLFANWRVVARRLLQQGVPPEEVWWQPQPNLLIKQVVTSDAAAKPVKLEEQGIQPLHLQQTGLNFGDANDYQSTAAHMPIAKPRASKAFVALAERVASHRRADRWALLYALLWRMNTGEPQLLLLASDPQVKQLQAMGKAINRDVHKMKAFVRFKTVESHAADNLVENNHADKDKHLRYVAWFEPEHAILPLATPFFVKRFSNMRWSILTPDGCVHWEGQPSKPQQSLWFSAGVDQSAAPQEDEFDQAWQTYYRHIFNPARLKIAAMQAEMPQKYWKNLPEAALIGELIQNAMQMTGEMLAAEPSPIELNCGPRPSVSQGQG